MKTWIYSLTFVLFFLFYSCDNQTKEALRTAEAFLEENPDSALFYLESIPAPELLSPKDYNDYLLLLVQAKDKAAEDISKDSLIFTLKGYYKKKDPVKDAQVSFYCGKICQKNKEYENAISYYLDAEDAIENTDREDVKGLVQFWIAYLFYFQLLWNESIEKFRQAEQHFLIANHYKNLISTYNQLGNIYVINNSLDSAFVYYNKSIEIADIHDPDSRGMIRNNIGVTFLRSKNYEEARKAFFDALSFSSSDIDSTKRYFSIAQTYLFQNKIDSFQFYSERILDVFETMENEPLKLDVYKTLYLFEEYNANYQKAIQYCKEYVERTSEFLEKSKRESILVFEKKYDYQRLQNQNKSALISQQRLILFLLATSLVLIVVIAFLWIKSIRNDKLLLKTKLDAANKMQELKSITESHKNKENRIRPMLVETFGIVANIKLLERFQQGDEKDGRKILKKVKDIVYDNEPTGWKQLFKTINALYDNILIKLERDYPMLDETDIQICCLSLGDLTNAEIGIILNYKESTILRRRTNIRRVLGLQNQGNIEEFLLKKYSISTKNEEE